MDIYDEVKPAKFDEKTICTFIGNGCIGGGSKGGACIVFVVVFSIC